MIKFLAVLQGGTGKVVMVSSAELNRVVVSEWAGEIIVLGEYNLRHHAERAIRLARRGRPPRRNFF
jgi:hypothetical protein